MCTQVGTTIDAVTVGAGLGAVVSGGVVKVTALLFAERLPAMSIAWTVHVVVRSGVRFDIENVVCGGSTRWQEPASRWTQYQNVESSIEAFQASEMLVDVLEVILRFVGVVGACLSPGAGGRLAGVAATKTRASTRALAARTVLLTDMAPPGS